MSRDSHDCLRSFLCRLSLDGARLKLRMLHGFNTDNTSERHVRSAQQSKATHPQLQAAHKSDRTGASMFSKPNWRAPVFS